MKTLRVILFWACVALLIAALAFSSVVFLSVGVLAGAALLGCSVVEIEKRDLR